MIKQFFITIFLIFTILPNANADENSSPLKIIEHEAEYLPDSIPVFDEKNNKHFLDQYEGKTILLVFWATWCTPCVQEMMDLDILQKDFKKTSLIILPISEDYTGIETIQKFYKDNEIRHLPILHDYKNALFKALNIIGMPTSIIINPNGMEVARISGAVNWYDENIRNILLKYIEGNPVMPKNSYKENNLSHIKPKNSNTESNDNINNKTEGVNDIKSDQ